ncbi:hypothetical protein THAOC_19318, partial [Thalassiosira oceanica]
MTVGTLCDNTPTVSWIENMASKASTPAAGRLLRGLAIMMLGAQMGPLITTHVAGDDNIMADIASRPTKAKQYFRAQSDHLTDPAFLKHFSTAFPLPHQATWRLATPAPDLVSNICETLRGKRLEMPRWMGMNGHGTGGSGASSAPSTISAATSTVCPKGHIGKGRKVGVQSVEKALRHVAQKFVLDRRFDPRRTVIGQRDLDLPFQRLLKKYDEEDPAPKPKLAIPVSTVRKIADEYNMSDHHSAVGDLVTVGFFFLLRVGEYTEPQRQRGRRKRTTPLRRKDVKFWKDGVLLPHNSPLSALLGADSATICVENQKNGKKGSTVHHKACSGSFCPVKALARRVFNIFWGSNSEDTILNHVYTADGSLSRVADRDINTAIRWGAVKDGLLQRGYTLDRVSSHSLRAAGAMALKLNGCSGETIKR